MPEFPAGAGARLSGQIIREKDPQNLEFPFSALQSFCTPNEQFYVRNHFARPAIDADAWRLTIEGAVQAATQFSLAELKSLPARTETVTLECAGNGRIFLVPQVRGAQWELGAVSTAQWKGVSLAELMRRCGIQPGARESVLEGADRGSPKEAPKPPGEIHYARSITVDRMERTLIAYEMNGQPLPPEHGFPVRAIVPGWYGMASVKWLQRIIAVEQPFTGYFQTVDYAYWREEHGHPVRVPITELHTKAQIARPAVREVVPSRSIYRVIGAAWTGDAHITAVEVSTDGGEHFSPAKLLGEPMQHAWRFWEYAWQTPAPGSCTLMARATDSRGHRQPMHRDESFGTYIVSHTLPIEVEVR